MLVRSPPRLVSRTACTPLPWSFVSSGVLSGLGSRRGALARLGDGSSPSTTLAKGSLKCSAIAVLTSWFCATIHITMKKAIIAVTKSAYATFHAPPPLPAIAEFRVQGFKFKVLAGIHRFQQRFQLLLAGAHFAAQAAAGHLQDDLRRLIVG